MTTAPSYIDSATWSDVPLRWTTVDRARGGGVPRRRPATLLVARGHRAVAVDLRGCGRFTLAEDLSDIKDIKSIDLSSISSLEGT